MPTAADIILNSIALTESDFLVDSTVGRQKIIEFNKKNNNVLNMCNFQSIPCKMLHDEFFRDCVDIILEEALFKGTDRKNKVINWKSPDELQKIIDFSVKHSPSTHEKLVQLIKNVIKFSVKTGHPYFMNQLFSRLVKIFFINNRILDIYFPEWFRFFKCLK